MFKHHTCQSCLEHLSLLVYGRYRMKVWEDKNSGVFISLSQFHHEGKGGPVVFTVTGSSFRNHSSSVE